MKWLLFCLGIVVLVGACTQQKPSVSGQNVGGGDPLRFLLREARTKAAELVHHEDITLLASAGAAQWAKDNQDSLTQDILESPHDWEDPRPQETCALTEYTAVAPIHFEFEHCRSVLKTLEDAIALLIHESVHHLGIADHDFADEVGQAYASVHSQQVSEYQPNARYSSVSVWLSPQQMWTWGGIGANGSVNGGFRLNTKEGRMSAISKRGAHPYSLANSVVWTGKRVLAFGGISAEVRHGLNEHLFSNDAILSSFDPITNRWERLTVQAFVPNRFSHASVWSGSRMYVWGGRQRRIVDGSVQYDPTDELLSYDPSSNRWESLTQAGEIPSPRAAPFAAWTGERVLVWGGYHGYENSSVGTIFRHGEYGSSGFHFRVDGGLYDPNTGNWEKIAAIPEAKRPVPRARFDAPYSAVYTGSQLAVVGGGKKLYLYDLHGAHWQQFEIPFVEAFLPFDGLKKFIGMDSLPRVGDTEWSVCQIEDRLLVAPTFPEWFPAIYKDNPVLWFDLNTHHWERIEENVYPSLQKYLAANSGFSSLMCSKDTVVMWGGARRFRIAGGHDYVPLAGGVQWKAHSKQWKDYFPGATP